MPFCRECGKEVQDDWKTCPHCSCSLTGSSQSKKTETDMHEKLITFQKTIEDLETATEKHEKSVPEVIVVNKGGNVTDSGDIVVGIICLVIAAISISNYQNSICSTALSPLWGEDCSLWSAFNLICGGFGLLAILLGLRGKPAK